MKIQGFGTGQTGERSGTINQGKTVLGPLKKESEFLNANGDVINPRTKEVLKRKGNESV